MGATHVPGLVEAYDAITEQDEIPIRRVDADDLGWEPTLDTDFGVDVEAVN